MFFCNVRSYDASSIRKKPNDDDDDDDVIVVVTFIPFTIQGLRKI